MLFPIGDDDLAELTLPVVTYALIVLNVLFFGLSTPASSNTDTSLEMNILSSFQQP